MLSLREMLLEKIKANQKVANKLEKQLLEQMNTNKKEELATNAELRSLVDEPMDRTTDT